MWGREGRISVEMTALRSPIRSAIYIDRRINSCTGLFNFEFYNPQVSYVVYKYIVKIEVTPNASKVS